MNFQAQTALLGGIQLAKTLGSAVWAVLLGRLDPKPVQPELADMLRDARAEFRKKQKGLRTALASIGATDSLAQLDSYHDKHAILTDVLDSKFASDDLNTDRYLTISDSVHAGLLSNLASLVNMQKSIAHVDVAELEHKMQSARDAVDYDHTAVVSLKERLQHVEEVDRNVGLLSAANEQALTAFDSSIVELSMLDISSFDSFERIEGAIGRLETLVAQAHKRSGQSKLPVTSEGDESSVSSEEA